MAQKLGPHTPKKGWALRWTRQAGGLLLRAPLALLVLAATVLALGALGGAARNVMAGPGVIAVTAALAAFAILPATLISDLLLRADGQGGRSPAELWDIARPYLLPTFALMGLQGLVDLLLPGLAGPAVPVATGAELALRTGVAAYLGAASVLAVLNVFWLGSSAALGLRPAEAWALQERISEREGKVFLALLVMTLMLAQLATVLPPVVALFAILAYQAWNYVAAREVLGGIDENGTPESAVDLAPHAA